MPADPELHQRVDERRGQGVFWEGILLASQIGIKITAGLRYQDSDRSINRSSSTASVNASDDWDAWLPKLGVSLALSEQDTLFASAAKGFQSGGFNYYGGTPESAQYDSAESWNYELGWSAIWNGGRLHASCGGILQRL